MWTGLATSPVACNAHSRNLTIGAPAPKPGKKPSGPTVAASTWMTMPPRGPMPVCPAAFLGAVVRTACAGHTVSIISSLATGALGSGLTHYIHGSPTGLIINPAFLELKDFVDKAFKGTLGATMAYLRMLHEGYLWFGHYEESLLVPLSSQVAQPDFVFTNGTALAIVEAKGTGNDLSAADDAAKNGYINQIDTAATRILAGGSSPTEGYAFGTALNLVHGALGLPIEMACVHQVFPPKTPTGGGGGGTNNNRSQIIANNQSVRSIKQLNYDHALVQVGLSRQDIDSVLARSNNPRSLYIGPELVNLQTGNRVFTASVAIRHSLLRNIQNFTLPEGLGRPETSGLPTVKQGDAPGHTFVEFPDHVIVLIRDSLARTRPELVAPAG